MANEICKILRDTDVGHLMDVLAPSMDDYLYVMDLKTDRLIMSESVMNRFKLPARVLEQPTVALMPAIYEEDREVLAKELDDIASGKTKTHDLHYRWLDKNGEPVWINCRGVVIDDEEGNPAYLIGCLNETGNKQRASNTSGLLGELEFRAYIREHKASIENGFLMHIGIDDFTEINGAKGNEYGDFILKSVANCIKKALASHQRVYYLAGDQYAVVDLESHSMDDAVALKNRITKNIYDFIISQSYESIFTVSIGVIEATTLSEGYIESRKKFEYALKQAKIRGKNSLYIFDSKDYELFLEKRDLKNALRNGIANAFEGFDIFYQPIMGGEDEKIVGAEALMRFFSPSKEGAKMISPMEFIPLLEETRLIIPAGRYVLEEAAKFCKEVQTCIPKFKINVNISYIQIMQGNVADDIIDVLKKYELTPKSICIEMTESGFVDDSPVFTEFREKLEKNDVEFVIDDFGTGYSNLHCINDMEPGYIKVDRTFTLRAMNYAKDFELFKKIIEMVHSIDIDICVEGVEKEEWCKRMKEMHVDYLQGYLFGRPCKKEMFLKQYVYQQEAR